MSHGQTDSFRWAALEDTGPSRPQARVSGAFALLVLLCLVPARTAARPMKLLSPSTGWLISMGHLYWTTDGGDHWNDITPVLPDVRREAVAMGNPVFHDVSEGWVLMSYPEGATLSMPYAERQLLAAQSTRKTLYSIAHTVNSGASWSFTPLSYPELPQWVQDTFAGPGNFYFLDALHGWIVMTFAGNSRPGKLLATEDGGRTWQWVNSPGSSGSIVFLSLQDGWLRSYGWDDKLYVTHDACKTWHEVSLSPPPQLGAATLPTFGLPIFQDERRGFLLVDYSWTFDTPSKLVIYSTRDSGQTWQPIEVLPEARDAWGRRGIPYAIADSSIIVLTGSSAGNPTIASVSLLDSEPSDVRPSYLGVDELTFADKRNGWVPNFQRGLLATHDGGSTWKHIGPPPLFTPGRSWTVPAKKGPPMIVTHE